MSLARTSRSLRLLALLLAMAAAVTLGTAAPAEAGGGGHRDLRVMSYNIHHGVGVDGVLDLNRLAALIEESGADVVALQEVDRHWSERSDWADQATELGALLDMQVAYGANLDLEPARPGEPRRQYGTALLSRHPILDAENVPLPNLGGEQRGLLGATIKVGRSRVRVYSTHLQHDDAAERAAQAVAIVDLIGDATLPVILAGDLNATAEAADLGPIVSSFTDSWTVGTGAGPTYPADGPDRRIDYVFLNDHVQVDEVEVVESSASDHLPLLATVRLVEPYAAVVPLEQAHAHNDYEHRRPLFDALHHGFTSVEADIWLQDGELRVAHDEDQTVPGRTLSELYLEPLSDLVARNDGWVYPGRKRPIQLLVDIKSEDVATYQALDEVLRSHRSTLTRFTPRGMRPGAVEVVISGNRPRALMESQRWRYAGYDGRLVDLDGGAPASFLPLLSDNWTRAFTWTGAGEMPAEERDRLHALVATVHRDGRRVRFWATPDEPGPERDAIWTVLDDAGVDHINTDDLAGLRAFLLDR